MTLYVLRIEIVTLGHVEVGNDIFIAFILKHAPFKRDVMEVLVVFSVLEMVYDC